MDPASILTVLGTSIAITKNVSDFITDLVSQTQNADRSLEQLRREVVDFQDVLQRLSDSLADPAIQTAAFETQTGNIGAHWRAVRRTMGTCSERLQELEELLSRLTGASATSNWVGGRFVRGVRLNFADSDIQFYRSEMRTYKENIGLNLQLIAVCRSMNGGVMSYSGQHDLTTIENEIRRLRIEMRNFRRTAETVSQIEHSSNQSETTQFSISRKPLANDVETGTMPHLNQVTIRNRRLETANAIEPTLDYASALVSTASTYLPARISLEDERRMQKVQNNPAIMEYVQDQAHDLPIMMGKKPRKRESNGRTTCMLAPRLIASLLLGIAFGMAVGAAMVVILFWSMFTICTACTKLKSDKVKISRDTRAVWNWFDERYRDIWY